MAGIRRRERQYFLFYTIKKVAGYERNKYSVN